MLARGYSELLTAAGFAVPHPVSLDRAGGRPVTAAHHLVWLLVKGIPWLWYRGRDLLPHAASILLRDLAGGSARLPPAAGSIGVDDRATHWAPVRTR